MHKKARCTKRKFAAAALAVITAAGSLFLPARDIQAAETPASSAGQVSKTPATPVNPTVNPNAVMAKVNVKWDLANKKTLTYKTNYSGLGMTKQKLKMSGFKIKNSTKKGYKELSFTLNFTRKWKITKKQIHKIGKSFKKPNSPVGGDIFYTIVDYNSGKNLELKNNRKVKVNAGKWKYSNAKTYSDKDGCWIRISNANVKIKITYPKSYKNLCIGAGGNTKLKKSKNDIKFWNRKATFANTTYYSKKDSSVAHFMRITDET